MPTPISTILTLDEAKRHLKITASTAMQDADIWDKTQEACAYVLDQVRRSIVHDDFTNASGVATVTTRHPHLLTTGATVLIRGAEQPEYNGTFTVTVTDSTTFTFTIVGDPETPATGTIGIRASQVWTSATVPWKVKAAAKLMLTNLYEHRGDDMATDANLQEAIRNVLADLHTPAMA